MASFLFGGFSSRGMQLEPFTIQCTTCGSSIRVRNPDLIGQLANCPKCQSMLMIELPTPEPTSAAETPPQVTVQPVGNSSADSSAMTREAMPAVNLDPIQDDDDEYRLAPGDPSSQHMAGHAGFGSEPDGSGESLATDEWRPGDAPLVPSDDWASASSARTRQYLLVGFLGFTGVVVAIVGFLAFLSWYNTSNSGDSVAANAGQELAVVGDPQNTDEPASQDDPGAIDIAGEPEVPVDIDPDLEIPAVVDPNSGDSETVDSELPPSLVDPVLPDNPIASTGSAGGSSMADEPGDGDSGGDEPDAGKVSGLPPGLKAMESFLDIQVTPTIPDEGVVPTEAPVTADELGLSTFVGREPLEPVDIAAQSKNVLHALAITQPPPLPRFINMWTHLSGIPVVVDFSSLASAGIDRNAPIALPPQVRERTYGEILAGTAKTSGLTMQTIDNSFVRLRAPTSLVPETLSMEELVGETQQEWLVSMLAAFYAPNLDASLDAPFSVSGGSLACDANLIDSSTWGEVVRTMETWRNLQLGKPSDFVKIPEQFLVQLIRDDRQLMQLEKLSSVVSAQSRPVGQTLSKLCSEAGLTCWIDWGATRQVGLGPQTTQIVVTHGRSLRRILADYAREYPLTVAILDTSSIWITSPKAYRSTVQVFVLPAEGKTALQWQSELRQLTPNYNTADVSSQANRSVLTQLSPDGNFVFVRSCLPTVDLTR